VLEALTEETADFDHDGAVSLEELQDHVTARVTQLTKGRQTPTARQINREQGLSFPSVPGLLFSFRDPHFLGSVDWVRFLPDGTLARKAMQLRVHDAATGRLLRTVPLGCALSLDGRLAVVDRSDRTVSLMDCASDTELHRLKCGDHPTAAAFSPDGRTVAIGRDNAVLLFDTETGAMRSWPLPDCATYDLVFSPDGKRLAYRLLRLDWVLRDVASGAEILAFEAGRPAFAPDGAILATQHRDDVLLHDAAGKEIRRLKTDADLSTLGTLVFLPDGRRIARADEDGIIRFWDVESGELVATFAGNRAVTLALAFSADGKRMANANADGTTKTWSLDAIRSR
jgi:WD40 repeat protein